MKVVTTDDFEFRFEGALDAFVFDETDSSQLTFHGVPMKAVDIVAEFAEEYIFVEIKDYDDPSVLDVLSASNGDEKLSRQKHFNWLKDYLKYKFRDSYLYRHAEQKADKPIRYICLLNFDNAMNGRMMKSLKQELPVGRASRRWTIALAKSCSVVNLDKWNENFPKWPVTRLPKNESAGGTNP